MALDDTRHARHGAAKKKKKKKKQIPVLEERKKKKTSTDAISIPLTNCIHTVSARRCVCMLRYVECIHRGCPTDARLL